MKNAWLILFVSLMVLGSLSREARADTIFNNGTAQVTGVHAVGFLADTGDSTFIEAGNVFTPTENGTVTAIDLAGYYFNDASGTPPSDSFTLNLYSTSSGVPTAIISTSTLSSVVRTVLGSSSDGYTIYNYTGNLNTPLPLSTTQTYYLGISDTTSAYEEFVVDDAVSPGLTQIEKSLDGATAPPVFFGGDGPIAFDLTGTAAVPEPSSLALFLLGGLLLGWQLRRGRATR